ncbi:MAG TPA: hypothetical protein VFZ59_26455 [Verrucomicrobiae bacterium]|nr:hypothetical protein [Verrucomicrobiae bacterium]
MSVFASLAGWTLSAFGFLNRIGYVVLGVVGLVVFIEMRARGAFDSRATPWRWRKFRHRLCRPFPLMFAVLTLLVFIGGVIYPPTNHTGLSYRVPRVLHWLQAEGWHWIYTPNPRLNTRACGIEWLTAPLLLFTKSDRGIFLLNFFSFLLLPGLLFSLLKRLGVQGRVAWQWMWILPTGYVFLLQAGSGGNDAFPAVYSLAAMDFACRAWKSRRASDLWYSLLAIALLGGAKASNLPLMLPWLVLVAPLWRLLRDQPLGTSRIVLIALVVSFLPTVILNLYYLGNWSGLNIERAGMDMKNPFVGIWGNALLLLSNNLCPPVFPFSGWWNQNILKILPGFLVAPMNRNFEEGYQNLWELPTEDWAGIGAGVGWLMVIATVWAIFKSRRDKTSSQPTGIAPLVRKLALLLPWLALIAYGAKSGMVTPGRLIAPYYPLLLPLLIVGTEQAVLVQQRWWRALVWLVFLTAFFVLIVTPARPLWPAQTILTRAVQAKPDSRWLRRALATYSVYSIRSDPLPELRAQLPANLKLVGFLGTPDDLDISFWRPYLTRQVAQISAFETAEQLRERKLTHAIVSGAGLEWFALSNTNLTLENWLTQTRAEVLTNLSTTITVSAGTQDWYVVRFKE